MQKTRRDAGLTDEIFSGTLWDNRKHLRQQATLIIIRTCCVEYANALNQRYDIRCVSLSVTVMITGLRLGTSVSYWIKSAWPLFVSLIGSRSPDRLKGPTVVNKLLLLLFISLVRWVKTLWWAGLEVIQEMWPPSFLPLCATNPSALHCDLCVAECERIFVLFSKQFKMTRNSRAHALIVGSKEQISLIDLIISLIQMLLVTSM